MSAHCAKIFSVISNALVVRSFFEALSPAQVNIESLKTRGVCKHVHQGLQACASIPRIGRAWTSGQLTRAKERSRSFRTGFCVANAPSLQATLRMHSSAAE
jgi:hypothetical protein